MKRFNNFFKQRSINHSSLLKVSLLFIFVIVLSTMVSASLVSEEEVIELGEPTEISLTKNFVNITSSQVSVAIPQAYEPENIRGYSEDEELECNYRETWGKEIICHVPEDPPENYSVTIEYETPSFTESVDGYNVFEYQKRVLVPTEEYSLEVILPEGSGIISGDDIGPYYPEDSVTGSEGRRIFIRWDLEDISLGETYDFVVRYQELEVLRNLFPVDIRTLGIIVALIVAISFSLYFKFKRKEETIASILPLLKEDEKKVLMEIIENGGECEQRKLVQELDYSKAKISRLVKDLEERNLLKKIKEGRKNRLVLKKEIGDLD